MYVTYTGVGGVVDLLTDGPVETNRLWPSDPSQTHHSLVQVPSSAPPPRARTTPGQFPYSDGLRTRKVWPLCPNFAYSFFVFSVRLSDSSRFIFFVVSSHGPHGGWVDTWSVWKSLADWIRPQTRIVVSESPEHLGRQLIPCDHSWYISVKFCTVHHLSSHVSPTTVVPPLVLSSPFEGLCLCDLD